MPCAAGVAASRRLLLKDSGARRQVLTTNVLCFGRLCRQTNSNFILRKGMPVDHAATKSCAEFAHYLRRNFVSRGYFFYVTGRIPDHKDPGRTDAKITAQYGLHLSKWARARRRKHGVASIQYLRFGREFIILATHGKHRFFRDEAHGIRDVRHTPLRVSGQHIHHGRRHLRNKRPG